MGGGPNALRRGLDEKSDAELVESLRSNFASAQSQHPNASSPSKPPSYKTWTSRSGSRLHVPALDLASSGVTEEAAEYDVTAKLFYLPSIPPARRCEHTREAVELVLEELHVPAIDLLIVSFPGISFDADDEEESDAEDEGGAAVAAAVAGGAGQGEANGASHVDDIDTMVDAWRTLEDLHAKGLIRKLGLAEFGSHRLSRFLRRTSTAATTANEARKGVRPSVDQINVRDCCVVPKQLILYARQEGIELLTHNDCVNVLPRGTIRELLGPGGAGVLAVPGQDGDGLRGEVEPQWVVKYTAVVKNRGVIENKGYFASAEVDERPVMS